MFVVIIGWVFFRADSLGRGIEYIKCMFLPNHDWIAYSPFFYLDRYRLFILILAVLLSVGAGNHLQNIVKRNMPMWEFNIMKYVGFGVLCVILTVRVLVSTYDPFIYFRF